MKQAVLVHQPETFASPLVPALSSSTEMSEEDKREEEEEEEEEDTFQLTDDQTADFKDAFKKFDAGGKSEGRRRREMGEEEWEREETVSVPEELDRLPPLTFDPINPGMITLLEYSNVSDVLLVMAIYTISSI